MGEDSISTDDEVLLHHGYSAWSTTNIERLPIAVVYPKSTAEVSQIVKICHQYRVPMSGASPHLTCAAATIIQLCADCLSLGDSTIFGWIQSRGKFCGSIWRNEYRLHPHGQNNRVSPRRVRPFSPFKSISMTADLISP